MPDNKYEKGLDRQAVPYDFKMRIIDMLENGFVAPEVGIYDEPVRYLKMNHEWFKLLAGWLSWMESTAYWKDAEDETYIGIQEILKFEEGIEPLTPSFPEGGDCPNFLPSAPFISYNPQNPYTDPDYVPPDYLVPPFFVNDGFEYPEILGYKATDIFINPASISIDPIDLITFNLPRIVLTVKGSGQVEIDFLAVQGGSRAILKVGSMPNIFDIVTGGGEDSDLTIVDLNNDVVSIPPERDIVVSEEINIEADDPETLTEIYIVFIPALDDTLIPLTLGGGLRQVGLCAFEDMAMIDCGDVEDCLETSETIININNNISNINTTIEDIEDCGCGGNIYPEPPTPDDEQGEGTGVSKICGAAFYIVDALIDLITETEAQSSSGTFEQFLIDLLAASGYSGQALSLLWAFWQASGGTDLELEVAAAKDAVVEMLFCAELDREAFRTMLESSGLDADVKNAYLAALDSLTEGKYSQLMFVGGEARQEDCSGMCSWVVVWDFDGSYVPADDEDVIYSGDHWEKTGCTYSGATGYTGFTDIWSISHELPPDCRVKEMHISVNKNVPCTATDVSTIWRGITGEDAPELTDAQRCLSNSPIEQNWTVLPLATGAELSSMTIQHNHFLCSPSTSYGSQTHWIRMEGTGTRPLE